MNTFKLLAGIDTGGAGSGLSPGRAPGVGDTPENSITNPILSPDLQGKSGVEFFSGLIPTLIGIGFVIGSVIFFFMLLIGAIQWIASGGDKNAIEGAKGKITNAFIGLVILFSIFAIIKLMEVLFNVSILTIDIGSLKIQ